MIHLGSFWIALHQNAGSIVQSYGIQNTNYDLDFKEHNHDYGYTEYDT